MTALVDSKGIADVLQRIQTLVRTYLGTVITDLGYTNLDTPLAADVQIGPEYNFSADPVVKIDWSSSTVVRYYNSIEDRWITIRVRLEYRPNVSVQTSAITSAQYDRALSQCLMKYYRDTDGTITDLDLRGSSVDVIDDFGWGVNLDFRARAFFTRPIA